MKLNLLTTVAAIAASMMPPSVVREIKLISNAAPESGSFSRSLGKQNMTCKTICTRKAMRAAAKRRRINARLPK